MTSKARRAANRATGQTTPDDARKLDHTTLEEMRIRAVRSVQAGESPEFGLQQRPRRP